MSVRIPASLRAPYVPLAAALLATGPAQAAELADALADAAAPEIIVTGIRPATNPNADPAAAYKIDRSASERFTEKLADTPKTVTIIPKEVIQDLGAQSFRDLVRTQPGVTLGTGEGGNAFGDRIFIRGFDARNDVYIDGLRDPGVTSREIFAVEQVEIVKGPSSTFGGRGTTGGAVSLISKAPQASNFATLEATGGTDATRRFTADVNRKLTDTLSLRVNGLWHDADVAGRDTTYTRRWGAAASLGWQAAPGVSIVGDYYHLTADGIPDWGVPFDIRSQEPFKVDRSNFYGVKARDFLEGRADIGTLRLQAQLSDAVTLTSKGRYGWNRNSYIASAPEGPNITDPNPANWTVRANPKNRNATSDAWANTTQLTAEANTGRLHHSLVVGADYSDEKIVNRPFAFASSETVGAIIVPTIPIIQNLLNPNPDIPYTQFRTLSGARNVARIKAAGVFLLDTVDIGDKVKLSGGIRYDDYRVTNVATTATGVVTRLRNKSDFVNWNAGVVYKPVPAATLYLSASTSSNPSGEQSDGSGISYGGLGPQTANLDPERNRSYEAGVKYAAGEGGHVLLNAALFRTDKTNARVNDPLSGVAQVLDGEQRVNGFELGAQGNITPRLAVFGGYTYLDAKVRRSTNPAEVGGRFPNIAKNSFALLTTYKLVEGLTIGGQANYNSRKFAGANVAGSGSVPGYWRFDATAKASISSNVEVQVNVLNLTNKTYYDAIYRSSTPFAYVAPGRSALATLRVKL